MDPWSGGDDKWKLSNKGRSRSGRPHTMDAASSSVLSRSYSASVSSSRTSAATTGGGGSSSSSSCHQQDEQQQAGSSSRLSKKKCVEVVKEHRARFYIVRRCVSMLVCWRDY